MISFLAQADPQAAAPRYFGKAIIDNLPLFLAGMGATICICIVAAVISLSIGLIIAVLRVTPSGGLKILATAYTEFFRNTPLIVQMSAFFLGVPRLINTRPLTDGLAAIGLPISYSFIAGTIALGLYTAAFVAEAIRAGLLVIPKGQSEAARSLGLSVLQTLRLVVIPQALRIVLPPLGNIYSAMLKNSAIIASIGAADLMFQAVFVDASTFQTFEVFTAVIVFYLMLTLPMGAFVHWLERKFNPLRARTLRLKGAHI